MSRRGIEMTLAQVQEHQKRHGFLGGNDFQDADYGRIEPKNKARSFSPKSRMNKTEREYGLILEAMKSRGEIVHYVYEGIRLTWGDGMRYLADYVVFVEDMPTKLIEVKGGYIWDRDLVRFKGCRAEWKTWFDFELWQKKAGQWARLL